MEKLALQYAELMFELHKTQPELWHSSGPASQD